MRSTDPEKEARRLRFLIETDRLAEIAMAEARVRTRKPPDVLFRGMPVTWMVIPQLKIPGLPYSRVEIVVFVHDGIPIDRTRRMGP